MRSEQPPVLFVRVRKGLVGESRRMVHVVPMPDEIPEELVAYCGETFPPGTIDRIQPFSGMPCVPCLAALRRTGAPPLPPAN